jgi:hypothetical protein
MIPANGAPHDLEARDVLRSLQFAQRQARDSELLPVTDAYRRIRGSRTRNTSPV